MQTLNLSNVPNQKFSTTLDKNRYVISIYQTSTCMSCDISCNEIQLVSGYRIVTGAFLIPFYMQGVNGNFILITQNDNLPDYTQFNTTQILMYLTAEEIAAAVGGTAP
jgi:hypothetical protein